MKNILLLLSVALLNSCSLVSGPVVGTTTGGYRLAKREISRMHNPAVKVVTAPFYFLAGTAFGGLSSIEHRTDLDKRGVVSEIFSLGSFDNNLPFLPIQDNRNQYYVKLLTKNELIELNQQDKLWCFYLGSDHKYDYFKFPYDYEPELYRVKKGDFKLKKRFYFRSMHRICFSPDPVKNK